jgi:hypothetical protein
MLPACLALGIWCTVLAPAHANIEHANIEHANIEAANTADAGNAESPGEPTKESCEAAVAEGRALADTLPTSDLSRVFAENYLHQAMVEAGNGEFDDCIERAEAAVDEVKERRHVLPPGKTLKDLGLREPKARR